jgi:hypothetical protein
MILDPFPNVSTPLYAENSCLSPTNSRRLRSSKCSMLALPIVRGECIQLHDHLEVLLPLEQPKTSAQILIQIELFGHRETLARQRRLRQSGQHERPHRFPVHIKPKQTPLVTPSASRSRPSGTTQRPCTAPMRNAALVKIPSLEDHEERTEQPAAAPV